MPSPAHYYNLFYHFHHPQLQVPEEKSIKEPRQHYCVNSSSGKCTHLCLFSYFLWVQPLAKSKGILAFLPPVKRTPVSD
ncbi:unnamed protein product [Menidia menidia]|uniref:(Atlantic silverside) hypothetical protein n=1 Tax=Menidia menidia TaxID=238744 RepID=A0A8S4BLE5_9TELE|nr:unnamed protein product [Menidia menidia]